jgi:prophage DNA circulation protein
MPMPTQPWRSALQPASYRGARFFVELDTQAGGRRLVAHEFPKKDTPFVEDMGRRARRWTVAGYLIGPSYIGDRAALIAACETIDGGSLVHPSIGTVQASCESYSTAEAREKGGYATFEMTFIETGSLTTNGVSTDTKSAAGTSADNLGSSSSKSLDDSGKLSLEQGGTISI